MIGCWKGNHPGSQRAVRRENAVISGQMGSWLGHQGNKPEMYEQDLAESDAVILQEWERRPLLLLRVKELYERAWEYRL